MMLARLCSSALKARLYSPFFSLIFRGASVHHLSIPKPNNYEASSEHSNIQHLYHLGLKKQEYLNQTLITSS